MRIVAFLHPLLEIRRGGEEGRGEEGRGKERRGQEKKGEEWRVGEGWRGAGRGG